jgi:GTP cyclohydrolase FolE2
VSKNIKAIQKTLEVFDPQIEDKTILILDVSVKDEYDETKVKVYTHTALFVNRRWYLTGLGGLLAREYATTSELMAAVARFPGASVSMVTETETVR